MYQSPRDCQILPTGLNLVNLIGAALGGIQVRADRRVEFAATLLIVRFKLVGVDYHTSRPITVVPRGNPGGDCRNRFFVSDYCFEDSVFHFLSSGLCSSTVDTQYSISEAAQLFFQLFFGPSQVVDTKPSVTPAKAESGSFARFLSSESIRCR